MCKAWCCPSADTVAEYALLTYPVGSDDVVIPRPGLMVIDKFRRIRQMRAGSRIGNRDGRCGRAHRCRVARDCAAGADGEPSRHAGRRECVWRSAARGRHGGGVGGAHVSSRQRRCSDPQPRADGNRQVGGVRQMCARGGVGNRNTAAVVVPAVVGLPVIAPPVLIEAPRASLLL